MTYEGDEVNTRTFRGRLRGLAWDQLGSSLTLVGNAGRVLKIRDGESISLDSGTTHSLRSVSINPINNTALVVGNGGTVIAINPNNIAIKIDSSTFENLRGVRWNEDGTIALIPGNNGTLLKYTAHDLEAVNVGRANLRGISWRKNTPQALVTSNCFAEEFIPSPNLFLFDANENMANPVSEGQSDLIGVDWNAGGSFAVVVGYDESSLSPMDFENSHVYPTAVSWDPTAASHQS